jgi:LytR cell envelope-related transcriptional attenuator
VLLSGLWVVARQQGRATPRPIPGDGDRVHVLVEVLNSTDVDGLARAVTRRLRRDGIDVVYYGSVRDSAPDSTRILIRRGDSTDARSVRRLLGLGRIASAPAPELLLDVTVILGSDAARLLHLDP